MFESLRQTGTVKLLFWIIFIIINGGDARTTQSLPVPFRCFVDVCDRAGYFECSATERRCKDCSIFYTDTCGTAQQPSGCYAYCAEKLKEDQMGIDNSKIYETNVRVQNIAMKLNATNRILQNEIHELNSTSLETRSALTESKTQVLNMQNMIEEMEAEKEEALKWRLSFGLCFGLCILLFVALTILIVCRTKTLNKQNTGDDEAERDERRMEEFHARNETRENANIHPRHETGENFDNVESSARNMEDTVDNVTETIETENDGNNNSTNKRPTPESGSYSPSECVTATSK